MLDYAYACVISVITAAAVHEDAFALDSAPWRARTSRSTLSG
jgi:hypothetical protein